MIDTILPSKIDDIITAVDQGHTDLPLAIQTMDGMSNIKIRSLFNKIGKLHKWNYLEVGTWKGATTCSVIFNNDVFVYCMDNFSQFLMTSITANTQEKVHPKVSLLYNINNTLAWSNTNPTVKFFETDCFNFDKNKIAHPINFYFYDGHHSPEDQYKAFTYFDDVLDRQFLTIIDDYNDIKTQEATKQAFTDLHYQVTKEWILPASPKGNCFDPNYWWNGLGIYIMNKL